MWNSPHGHDERRAPATIPGPPQRRRARPDLPAPQGPGHGPRGGPMPSTSSAPCRLNTRPGATSCPSPWPTPGPPSCSRASATSTLTSSTSSCPAVSAETDRRSRPGVRPAGTAGCVPARRQASGRSTGLKPARPRRSSPARSRSAMGDAPSAPARATVRNRAGSDAAPTFHRRSSRWPRPAAPQPQGRLRAPDAWRLALAPRPAPDPLDGRLNPASKPTGATNRR